MIIVEKSVEIDNIIVQSVNFISFTKVFKYLGSWIKYNICDEYDILQKIKKIANFAIGALNCFWNADSVDLHGTCSRSRLDTFGRFVTK